MGHDGEFLESHVQAFDNESASITSPVTLMYSISTSSYSSLSDSLNLPGLTGKGNSTHVNTPFYQGALVPTNSHSSSKSLIIKPSTSDVIARLHSLVQSCEASSDSDQSQLHDDKLGLEATNIKLLTNKISTHAMNPDLPHQLHSEPSFGLELLAALS